MVAGQEYEFNATLTKDTPAAKRTRWMWAADVPGSETGYRCWGAAQFGTFRIPKNLTTRYPNTLQVRLVGVDGLRRIYEAIKIFTLEKE